MQGSNINQDFYEKKQQTFPSYLSAKAPLEYSLVQHDNNKILSCCEYLSCLYQTNLDDYGFYMHTMFCLCQCNKTNNSVII